MERLEVPVREAARTARAISRLKQADPVGRPRKGLGRSRRRDRSPRGGALLPRYERELEGSGACDLDDLILAPVRLLLADPAALAEARRGAGWVLVDEAQDLNPAQYRLLRVLLPGPQANLFLIGDPDQAIYGFRGADPRLIGRLAADYPGCRVYRLRTSYRCPARILQAARRVLGEQAGTAAPLHPAAAPGAAAGAAPGDALRGLEEGPRLQIVEQASDRAEAEFVARAIETMLGGVSFFSLDSGVSDGERVEGLDGPADFAVLCRVGRQMAALEKAFKDHSIPYQLVGEVPFFRQEPARTLVDLLRLVADPEDRPLLRGLLERRGVSLAMLENAFRLAREGGSLRAVVAGLARLWLHAPSARAGGGEEDLQRLAELAAGFGERPGGFPALRLAGLGGGRLAPEARAGLPAHPARRQGAGVPLRLHPRLRGGAAALHAFRGADAADPAEEEARLLYVGMTRAKRFLFLLHAGRRSLFGRELRPERSRLLERIGDGLAEVSRLRLPRRAPARQRQLDLFQ